MAAVSQNGSNCGLHQTSDLDSKSVHKDYPIWQFWKRRRYTVAIFAFFGFFNVYALRVNLSIAIVAMTEEKNITLSNGTVIHAREFDWNSKLQGYILSSFFYGYITTQLLGGVIAARIGGQKVFGIGIAVTAGLTFLTPWLAGVHVYLLLAVRIVEGVFEGVTYPCIHAVWARWAPPLERTRLATLAFSGSYVGTVVAMPICAYLAETFGWPSIFYCFGTIGLIWCAAWWFFVAESPETDKRISAKELKYITEALNGPNSCKKDGARIQPTPWKAILTSVPVWAIIMSHFSENWGFYTMLTQLPKFMKDALNFDLGQTGYMSALPYLAMSIMIQISGYLADLLQVKGILTTTQVRKYFNCGGFLAQMVFMLGAAYLLSPIGSTLCLTIAVGMGGFAWAGFSVNYLDVAPQHASVMMGIGNTIGTLPGIISPILGGYIVSTPTAQEWKTVFFIASGIYLIGCIVYGLFASGELQPWAQLPNQSNDSNKETERKNESAYNNKAFQSDDL